MTQTQQLRPMHARQHRNHMCHERTGSVLCYPDSCLTFFKVQQKNFTLKTRQ